MLNYDLVDVFTDRPFAGNQLAVVHGADDLSTAQCLAIAQEFNFSETTFPSSAVADGKVYTTRIFTPGGEIPFAGHPTLGTAWVLRELGALDADQVTQVCGAGKVEVRLSEEMVELAVPPRDLVGPLDEELVTDLASDIGLAVSDVVAPVYIAGCGLTFLHLPVADDAVARAVTSPRPLEEYRERFAAAGPSDPVEGINVFAVAGSAPSLQVHSRVFVPGLSVPEDPATGSAAAALGMALVATGLLPDGGTYQITQGVEMGRRSILHGSVETTVVAGHGWNVTGSDEDRSVVPAVCRVRGQVQRVGRGEIAVPG